METKKMQVDEMHFMEEPIYKDESVSVPGHDFVTYRDTTREALEILLGMGTNIEAISDQGMGGTSTGEPEPEIITAARDLRSKLVREGIL